MPARPDDHSTTHRLVLVRHAKAEQSAPTDFERPLSERGRRDARAAGAWLADRGIIPDAALVSAAVRATQTWQELCAGGGYDESVAEVDRGLYQAGVDTTIDLVRFTDESVRTLVVVGHNPTMEMFALLVDDGTGELDPSAGYPTSALTVFELDDHWDVLGPQRARATAHHVGRG